MTFPVPGSVTSLYTISDVPKPQLEKIPSRAVLPNLKIVGTRMAHMVFPLTDSTNFPSMKSPPLKVEDLQGPLGKVRLT